MAEERKGSLIVKELLKQLLRKVTSRTFLTGIIFLLVFAAIWSSLYRVQILDAEHYREMAAENTYQEQEIEGIRGCIYDRYGRPLAVNTTSLALYYTPDADNEDLNQSILYLLEIFQENGDEVTLQQEFPIGYDVNTGYYYQDAYDAASNEIALYNFLAEIYNTSRDELTSRQKMTTAEDAFVQLQTVTFHLPQVQDQNTLMMLASIRYAIFCGRWNSTTPVLIAKNISEKTQAAIMERRSDFTGFTVETVYSRQYPEGELFAHIVGYAGYISEDELADRAQDGYTEDDIIGKTGIELKYESELRGTDGLLRIELDGETGNRVNETTLVPATQGNSIFLTIDRDIQEAAYQALKAQIKDLLIRKMTGVSSEDGKTYSLEDIYCALIDNNYISIQQIESSTGVYAASFKSVFDQQSEWNLEQLRTLILSSDIMIGQYDEIIQDTYNLMIEFMRDNEHLSYDYQKDEAYYEAYAQGKKTAGDFMEYCLRQGYINTSIYGIGEEENIDIILSTVIDSELSNLRRNSEYKKLIYRYIIQKNLYSDASFLYMLYEEDLIHNTDGSREAVMNGSLSLMNCLIRKIQEDEITPADLNLDPCSGSVVMTDCSSGEILAIVSYPSYDPNLFISSVTYYNQIVMDNSGPLTFRALDEMRAIGSTYKMCTAITGLDLGYIDADTTVYDQYEYPNVNSVDKPRCWSVISHGNTNVVTALDHSCNYFFYDLGFRLCDPKENLEFDDSVGLKKMAEYAKRLGLATPTGIEIGEGTPHTSDQDAVRSAIGQGTNAFSAANINRYTCTIANQGSVYNLYLVDEIHTAEGKILYQAEPEKVSDTQISSEIYGIVQQGMRLVVTDEHAEELSVLDQAGLQTAGKTGTAQELEDRPDHSLFTGFAPYESPEVVVTVVIPYGGGSSNAIPVFRDVIANYYGIALDTKQ